MFSTVRNSPVFRPLPRCAGLLVLAMSTLAVSSAAASAAEMSDLGTLGGTSSFAFAINDLGQVIVMHGGKGGDHEYGAYP